MCVNPKMKDNDQNFVNRTYPYTPIPIKDFIENNPNKSIYVNICKSIFSLKENEDVTIINCNQEDSHIDTKYTFIKCKVVSLETKTEYCTIKEVIEKYLTGNVLLKIKDENLSNMMSSEELITLPIDYISIDIIDENRESTIDLLLNSNNKLMDKLVRVIKTRKELRHLSIGDELLIDSEEMFNIHISKDKKHLLSDINYKDLEVIFKINNFIVGDNDEVILKGGILLDKCGKLFLNYLHLFDIRDGDNYINDENIINYDICIDNPILVINKLIDIRIPSKPYKKIHTGNCDKLEDTIKMLLCNHNDYISNLNIPEITKEGLIFKQFQIHEVSFYHNEETNEINLTIIDKSYDENIYLNFIDIKLNIYNVYLIDKSYYNFISDIRKSILSSISWYTNNYINK